MCGLAGFIKPGGFTNLDSESVIESMCSSIIHRGPDSFGLWIDHNVGIALGHRRLSILELSDAGKQPMISFSGRYFLLPTYQ
jgi:asparagine synthase (glutamine-hydrolysing)